MLKLSLNFLIFFSINLFAKEFPYGHTGTLHKFDLYTIIEQSTVRINIWQNYTKNPTDIHDKENNQNKNNSIYDRYIFDLHGYTLLDANIKVKEIERATWQRIDERETRPLLEAFPVGATAAFAAHSVGRAPKSTHPDGVVTRPEVSGSTLGRPTRGLF